jgi:hypothetical protein
MSMMYPNQNRRVSFDCWWEAGCSDSKRCNYQGFCVAAAQNRQMEKPTRDVTAEYAKAQIAVKSFNPGEQADIGKLMRSAFVHGYAQALIDAGSANDGEVDANR